MICRTLSDLIFVLEDGVKYTDGTPVAEEDYDALHEEYDLMLNGYAIDYMDRVDRLNMKAWTVL